MRTLAVAFIAMSLVGTACAANQPQLLQMPSAEDARLTALSATLALLPITVDDADPSRGARPELTLAKHQLRDWIDWELTRVAQTDDAKEIASRLNSELEKAKISGRLLAIRAWNYGPVLVIATSFAIVCGTDDSTYGWVKANGTWKRTFSHEITDYTPGKYRPQSIEDGFDGIYFSPTAGTQSRGIYVLTTAVNTRCTSGWLGRRYQLNYVDVPNTSSSLMLDEDVDAFVLEGNRRAELSPTQLKIYFTGNTVDPRKMPFRDQLRLYTLEGSKAELVPEAFADAEDFIETWLTSTWTTSAARTAATSHLEAWHRQLRRHQSDDQRLHLSSFAEALPCRDDPKLWQYGIIFGQAAKSSNQSEVDSQPLVEKKQPDGSILATAAKNVLPWIRSGFVRPQFAYFLARENSPHRFTMIDILKAPRAQCPIASD